MTRDRPTFVSFESSRGKFFAFLPMDRVLTIEGNPEVLTHKAAITYERAILRMRNLMTRINTARSAHKPVPARVVWEVGNMVFTLRGDLEKLSLQLNGVYAHLTRDIGVKRQWLEKAIILRRYLPDKILIPVNLNWGRCEKGTRRVADRLRRGLSAH
jgi:hypothetical protein